MSSNVVPENVEPISEEIVVDSVVQPEPVAVVADEDKVEAVADVSGAE